MDELIQLLKEFNLVLRQQNDCLSEFVFILDQEEQAIANYHFLEIEKSVIQKDQHTRLSSSLEEKRIQLLKKICSMMAFDSRGQTLTLPLFKIIFSTYLENVKKLLSDEINLKLEELKSEFFEILSKLNDIDP